VDQAELFQEAIKYYANILTPFSPLVTKKIEEVLSFNLPVNMICTSHGVIWRDNPVQIVEQYLKWANNYQEDQVTLVYDSMWRGTARMAEGIAEGLKKSMPGTTIKLVHAGLMDKNDVITELFKSKAILVGSSTINKGILSSMAAVMEMVKGLKFKNKKGAAFGSYGWSGESVPMLEALLVESGIEMAAPGIKELWNPDDTAIARCLTFGEELGKKFSIS
jgi:anaerobic nitric oxide reductase flavorubredoxin